MDLTATVERLASNPDLQTLDSSTRDTIKSLRSLLNDQRFQKSYQFAQKVTTSKILHKPRTAALTSSPSQKVLAHPVEKISFW